MSLRQIEFMRDMSHYAYTQKDVRTSIIVYRRILRQHVKDLELRSILFNDFCRSLTSKSHTSLWTTNTTKVPHLEKDMDAHVVQALLEHQLRFQSFLHMTHDRWLQHVSEDQLVQLGDVLTEYMQMQRNNGYAKKRSPRYDEEQWYSPMYPQYKPPHTHEVVAMLWYGLQRDPMHLSSMLCVVPNITLLHQAHVLWLAEAYPRLLLQHQQQDIELLNSMMNTLLQRSAKELFEPSVVFDQTLMPTDVYALSSKYIRQQSIDEELKDQAWVLHVLMYIPLFYTQHMTLQWAPSDTIVSNNCLHLPMQHREAWMKYLMPMLDIVEPYYQSIFHMDIPDRSQRISYIREQLHQLTLGTPNIDDLSDILSHRAFIHYMHESLNRVTALDIEDDILNHTSSLLGV